LTVRRSTDSALEEAGK